MKTMLCTIVAVLIVAAPATAQDNTQYVPEKPKKPKMICRSESVTGRRIADETCHTADQWAALDAEEKKRADDFVNRALQNQARSGAGAMGTSAGAMGGPR